MKPVLVIRRVAAVSVATRVAEEMGTQLGDEVGYMVCMVCVIAILQSWLLRSIYLVVHVHNVNRLFFHRA